eukprot:scaffold494469_cov28-Prasinocladus_malaysianus.AAC.1
MPSETKNKAPRRVSADGQAKGPGKNKIKPNSEMLKGASAKAPSLADPSSSRKAVDGKPGLKKLKIKMLGGPSSELPKPPSQQEMTKARWFDFGNCIYFRQPTLTLSIMAMVRSDDTPMLPPSNKPWKHNSLKALVRI